MNHRTDLALEEADRVPDAAGIDRRQHRAGAATVTQITVRTASAAQRLRKPVGRYVTVEVPRFSDHADDENRLAPVIARELRRLIPSGSALVAGLGNAAITPDAVGPQTAAHVIATRHLRGEFARAAGLDQLRPVSVVTPGVMGCTGIETAEFLRGIVRESAPDFLIVIDALAAASAARLGNTVQLCDTGISPGSGVHNARPKIDRDALGVPVIAVGLPTVIDGAALDGAPDAPLIVTPREIDLLLRRAAHTLGVAINLALQPTLTLPEITQLMA